MIKRLAIQIPGVEIKEMERIITMPSGGTVQVRSADNPDSLRGEGLDYLVMDECAFIKQEAWFEALRPALADRKGKALFISTPQGHNWFHQLWSINDGKEWRSWRFSSYDNPFVADSEIDAAKQSLPERVFSQEFLAEFLADGNGVFRKVRESAIAEPMDKGAPGKRYVYGVDWGKSNDFTVIVVIDPETKSMVAWDRFNQIDYMLQMQRLQVMCERFQPLAIYAERNSMGEPLIELLQRKSLPVKPFTTTNASKAEIIDGLSLAFERGEIQIFDDPVLVGELLAYDMERLPSGLMRYGAPAGQHDDCVMALALAWQGSNKPPRREAKSFQG